MEVRPITGHGLYAEVALWGCNIPGRKVNEKEKQLMQRKKAHI